MIGTLTIEPKRHTKIMSILFTFIFLVTFPQQICSLSISSAASAAISLKDHSSTASSLFNNMRTPAALIGGAIVPLGILSAPPLQEDDGSVVRLLKKGNMLLAIASLLSEILAITYSTVAINKLAEVTFPPTSGVSDLISSHFELAWIGTNVHFLLGMFGFGLLVGTKAYFTYGGKLGKIAGSWSFAAFLQCTSIVNNGISMGQGNIDDLGFHGSRYANNLLSLCLKYIQIIFSTARTGPLPLLAIMLTLYSIVASMQLISDVSGKSASKAD